ncbi:MAG: hypothetical protein JRM71_00935 [Nitrososphaerota archaeon]|nr:hypothetical protein [Nitrososphaerota archaeon]
MSDFLDWFAREREVLKEAFTWRGIARRRRFDEYASIEHTLIKRFLESISASKSPSTVEVEGFVSRMGDRKFLLRPTLGYDYGVICNGDGLRTLPVEYAFVHVKGVRVLPKSGARRVSANVLDVTDCEVVRLPTEGLSPGLSLKDAADRLMAPFVDAPLQLSRNILYSLTSSPGELRRGGGLTAALMPLKEAYSSSNYWLLRELQQYIPRDLTGDNRVKIRVAGAGELLISPFPWSIHNASEASWDPVKEGQLLLRASEGPSLRETTVGFAASSAVPKSLDDVWIRQADFPTLTDDDLAGRGRSGGFDRDLALYFISTHMNRPRIENNRSDAYLGIINRGLLRLQREYDSQGFSGLVSFDSVYGSARSVESIARAMARIDGSDIVKEEHARDALDEFVNAREAMFDMWAEKGKTFGPGVPPEVRAQKIGPSATKLYRYIRRHPKSSRGEVREEFSKTSDRIFDDSMDALEKQGCIYPTSHEDQRYSAIEP